MNSEPSVKRVYTPDSLRGLPIKGVLFDLYSTLVEETPSNPFYQAISSGLGLEHTSFYTAYRSAGNACMRGELATMADRVSAACASIGRELPMEFVRQVVQEHMPLFYQSVHLYPETRDVLEAVRAEGLRTALVSNASSYSEEVLSMYGLRRYFDVVVLSYRVRCLKPNPDIYFHALRELQLAPEECIFVGDGGDSELEGAARVGLQTVLVNRLNRDVSANHTIMNLRGFLPILTLQTAVQVT